MATQQAPDAGSGSGVPTCYRHAGRETYLSCTRCGRPACPECLRSAPVGQQCVECVKEGGRTVRRPSGVFGGRAVSGATAGEYLVVKRRWTAGDAVRLSFDMTTRMVASNPRVEEEI